MNRQSSATVRGWAVSLIARTWRVAPLVAALAAASCTAGEDASVESLGGTATDDGTAHNSIDSESHFLSFCAEGCGDGLRCVCGVCTRACDESSDCRQHDEAAECVPPTPANPESCVFNHVRRVCDVECTDAADCASLDGNHVCNAGVCRQAPPPSEDCPATTIPTCSDDQELRTTNEYGCPSFECVGRRACPTPLSEASCGDPSTEAFTFDAASGVCLVHDYGQCSAESNNFESLEQCWGGCAPEYQGSCIEGWDANWESADVVPVAQNNLTLRAATITREFALGLVSGEYEATLTYPHRTQTRLTLRVDQAEAYHVTSTDNPGGSSLGIGPHCWDHVVVTADVSFVTDDGQFDERWQGVRFTVNAWDAFANLSLWASGQWNAPRGEDEPVTGSYQPDLDEESCSLSSNASLNLVSGALSGGIHHLVVGLPCEDVTESTPISTATRGNPAPPTQTPVPSGPVWSTHVSSVDGQFCACASPNRRGPDEPGDTAAAAHLLAGEEPRYRIAADATAECESASGADCTPESFLTIWAAECIARADGLEEGIEPWQSGLRHHDSIGRVVWSVGNTLTSESDVDSSGQTLDIDAITGEVLSRSFRQSQP